MTVSHWRRTEALGMIRTEVLVVGAGICGVSAALELQRRGVDYRVVDRQGVGAGASTRNGGFLMRGAAPNYRLAIELYGREMARTVWRWTEDNLEGLRREGIESLPTYQRIGSCLLALEQDQEHRELLESVRLLREDGFEAQWLETGQDTLWRCARARGGLLNLNDAACNSYDLMRFLSGKLSTPVLEGQEVAELRGGAGSIRARVSDGWIEARHVLLCTNAYVPLLLPGLAGLVTARRGQMLALGNTGLRLDYSYYANYGYEYFRQTTDGTVVVGGCRRRHAEAECGYEDRTTTAVQDDLEEFASRALGIGRADLEITARWSGTMGFSPDGLPLVGPVHGAWEPGRVWFCGAFTGHGMSMGHRTARAAVGALLDGEATPFPLARATGRISGPPGAALV